MGGGDWLRGLPGFRAPYRFWLGDLLGIFVDGELGELGLCLRVGDILWRSRAHGLRQFGSSFGIVLSCRVGVLGRGLL